jgi:hypothetical protein
MTTIKEKAKQEILVWSVIVGVFTILTFIAINLDRIHQSLDKDRSHIESPKKAASESWEPGYSIVLAQ